MTLSCSIPAPAAPPAAKAAAAALPAEALQSCCLRAYRGLLTGLFGYLGLPAGPRALLCGPERLFVCLAGWKTEGAPRLLPADAADETLLWRLPSGTETVVLFDVFPALHSRALALRKLFSLLPAGGFAVLVHTRAPLSTPPDGQRELPPSALLHRTLVHEAPACGFSVIKEGRYKNRFLGPLGAAQRRLAKSSPEAAGANLFHFTPGEGLRVERSPFIAPGRVLEKAEVDLLVLQKPAPRPAAPFSPSVFGAAGRVVFGDRRADFMLDPGLSRLLDAATLGCVERCLSRSFSALKKGADYSRVVGRSLFINLPSPLTVEGRDPLLALKIKGAVFESAEPFAVFGCNPDSMLDFDRNGVLKETNFEDKPVGSMTFPQAANEFELMRAAARRGIHTDLPLGVCLFPDLIFQNRPAGAVVMGLAALQGDDNNRFFMQFNRLLGHTRYTNARYLIRVEPRRLAGALALLQSYGRQLRRFHDAGLLHILGHNNQISVGGGKIFFHDFEYSRLQRGMTRRQKTAYRLQDLRRALFGLKIYRSEKTLGVDFCRTFLSGYFFDAPGASFWRGLGEETLNDIILKFHDPRQVSADALLSWMIPRV